MTRVITNEYKANLVDVFVNEVKNNEYYIFASTIESDIKLTNSVKDKREFLEKTLFGKRINDGDVYPTIRNIPWVSGLIYDQYDDSLDMNGKNFYTVVYPDASNTGKYLIFKCLYNNQNSPSSVAPFFQEDIPNQIYTLADGYVWKFMYDLETDDFDQYISYGYIPVIKYANTTFIDTQSISHIEVTNPVTNFGYEAVTGTVISVNNEEVLTTGPDLNSLENYYRGQYMYLTISGVSNVYEILSYSYNQLTARGTFTLKNKDALVVEAATFSIVPRIDIKGNGFNAVAVPIISNGRITKVNILNPGYGYSNAIATVVDPEFGFTPGSSNTQDERAIIRPVLSPGSGHAMDIATELNSTAAVLSVGLTRVDNESKAIPTTRSYCRVGLVKNPQFTEYPPPQIFDNRIEVSVTTQNFLLEGERVIQIDPLTNDVLFESVVHESSGNTVYLTEFMGPYEDLANTSVSFDGSIGSVIIGENDQPYVINSSTIPSYVQRSGEVVYMISYTDPIERTPAGREQFKVLLQF